MALFGGIASFTRQNIFGYALGSAAGRALHPVLQEVTNEAWAANPARPLPAELLAAGVAQGQVDPGWAHEWAGKQGISGDAFNRMVAILNSGPGIATGFELWRRGLIDKAGFHRALKRAAIEDEWVTALDGLHDHLLTPAELANARQQGFVDEARQHTESAQQGVTADRADILFNLAGLPPGAATMQEALNRGFISEAEFAQGIREGHTKTKYTDLLKRMRAAVLSPAEAASARLRTWIDAEESYAIGAQHGYTREQMDLLFLNRGRPASPTQMWTAYFRKVDGPRGVPTDYEDHAKAIAISDIRPEYAELLWGIRFAYPSLFQLGRLVSIGAIDPDTAVLWASYNRYGADVTDKLKVYWQSTYKPGGTTGQHLKALTESQLRAEYEGGFITPDELVASLGQLGYSPEEATVLQHLGDAGRVKTYRDKVLAALHKAYLTHTIDDSVAGATMSAEGISAEAQASLLRLWRLERDFARADLTPAQVKRAYKRNLITRDAAVVELVDRGYTTAAAGTLLDE